jgi:hypothetical protein
MSLVSEQIQFLRGLNKGCVHGKNILAKKDKDNIEIFFPKYREFYSKMDDNDIDKKINAFINYREFVRKNNIDDRGKLIFSSQSKFESTILEEFLYHLFKNLTDSNIKVGQVKAYNNLYFSPPRFDRFKSKNFIKINQKDQDFAIYKKVIFKDENETYELFVPVVSIECKTYIDKTMLEGSIATAEKIKTGNPHCKFYIVTETYDVDYKVDPSTSRIDNIFVIRKGKDRTKSISPDVLKKLYNTIKQYLQSDWSNIEKNIKEKGTIY